MKLKMVLNQKVLNHRLLKKIIIILLALLVAAITTSFGFGIKKAHGSEIRIEVKTDVPEHKEKTEDVIESVKFTRGDSPAESREASKAPATTTAEASCFGTCNKKRKTVTKTGAIVKKSDGKKGEVLEKVGDTLNTSADSCSHKAGEGNKEAIAELKKIGERLGALETKFEKFESEMKEGIKKLEEGRTQLITAMGGLETRIKLMMIGLTSYIISLEKDAAKAEGQVKADLVKQIEDYKKLSTELASKRQTMTALTEKIKTLNESVKSLKPEESEKKGQIAKELEVANTLEVELKKSIDELSAQEAFMAEQSVILRIIHQALTERLRLTQPGDPLEDKKSPPDLTGRPRGGEGESSKVSEAEKLAQKYEEIRQVLTHGARAFQRQRVQANPKGDQGLRPEGLGPEGPRPGSFRPGGLGTPGKRRGTRNMTVMDGRLMSLIRAGE